VKARDRFASGRGEWVSSPANLVLNEIVLPRQRSEERRDCSLLSLHASCCGFNATIFRDIAQMPNYTMDLR
jgi:hypothetical protein